MSINFEATKTLLIVLLKVCMALLRWTLLAKLFTQAEKRGF